METQYFKLSRNEYGKMWLLYKPSNEPGRYNCWEPIDEEFWKEFEKLLSQPVTIDNREQTPKEVSIIAAQKQVMEQQDKKIKELEQWKKEQLAVWGPVIDYMQDNWGKMGLAMGGSISSYVLKILKEQNHDYNIKITADGKGTIDLSKSDNHWGAP